jgi:hypothetical protein
MRRFLFAAAAVLALGLVFAVPTQSHTQSG